MFLWMPRSLSLTHTQSLSLSQAMCCESKSIKIKYRLIVLAQTYIDHDDLGVWSAVDQSLGKSFEPSPVGTGPISRALSRRRAAYSRRVIPMLSCPSLLLPLTNS